MKLINNRYKIYPTGVIIDTKTGCELNKYIGKKGYPLVYLDGVKTLHRLLATHFIPNPDNKEIVNHIDGNKLNYSLDNLDWVTRKENSHHAYYSGLFKDRKSWTPRLIALKVGETIRLEIKRSSLDGARSDIKKNYKMKFRATSSGSETLITRIA